MVHKDLHIFADNEVATVLCRPHKNGNLPPILVEKVGKTVLCGRGMLARRGKGPGIFVKNRQKFGSIIPTPREIMGVP